MRQRQLVADASHELRTPLTSILANLELLTEVLDGERGEAARSALRSSQRMRRLVGDLLLLARADANRQLPREPTDVGRVLVEAAAELGPVADGHELTIDSDEAVVNGARDELHRMTLNLMENAISHTPEGTHVSARVAADNGEVLLTVEDNGPGVPTELRERVFERFVRGAGDRGSSSGLGLSIVRAVAESHGGSVELEDARPGARFVVRLPWAEVPAETPAPTPA
jgi:two-component system, OmpR family, sensor kinase